MIEYLFDKLEYYSVSGLSFSLSMSIVEKTETIGLNVPYVFGFWFLFYICHVACVFYQLFYTREKNQVKNSH